MDVRDPDRAEMVRTLKVTESIAVPLSKEDIMLKASLAAALVEEIEKVETAARDQASEFKTIIQGLKSKQLGFLRCVRTGKDYLTDVPCDQVFKLESKVAELWYDGQLVSTRPMTPKEQALMAPTVFEHAEAMAQPAGLPEDLPADLSLPGVREQQISDVIKEETNKKKKKDLLK